LYYISYIILLYYISYIILLYYISYISLEKRVTHKYIANTRLV